MSTDKILLLLSEDENSSINFWASLKTFRTATQSLLEQLESAEVDESEMPAFEELKLRIEKLLSLRESFHLLKPNHIFLPIPFTIYQFLSSEIKLYQDLITSLEDVLINERDELLEILRKNLKSKRFHVHPQEVLSELSPLLAISFIRDEIPDEMSNVNYTCKLLVEKVKQDISETNDDTENSLQLSNQLLNLYRYREIISEVTYWYKSQLTSSDITQVSKALSEKEKTIFHKWCQLKNFEINRKLFVYNEDGSITLSSIQALSDLSKSARFVSSLGYTIPSNVKIAIENFYTTYSESCKLKQIIHVHNTIHLQMVPSQRPLMLKEATSFERDLKKADELFVNRPSEFPDFVEILQHRANTLLVMNNRLRKFHERMIFSLIPLLNSNLFTAFNKWRENLSKLREIVFELQEFGSYDQISMQAWLKHWDCQIYKVMRFCFGKGFSLLSETLKVTENPQILLVEVNLFLKDNCVAINPTVEEIRRSVYANIKRFLQLPMNVQRLASSDDHAKFSSVINDSLVNFSELFSLCEKTLAKLCKHLKEYESWLAIYQFVKNIGLLKFDYAEHWEYNIKLIDHVSEKLERLPKIYNFYIFKLSIEAIVLLIRDEITKAKEIFAHSLFDNITISCEKMGNYIKEAKEILSFVPHQAKEFTQIKKKYLESLEMKASNESILREMDKKVDILSEISAKHSEVSVKHLVLNTKHAWHEYENFLTEFDSKLEQLIFLSRDLVHSQNEILKTEYQLSTEKIKDLSSNTQVCKKYSEILQMSEELSKSVEKKIELEARYAELQRDLVFLDMTNDLFDFVSEYESHFHFVNRLWSRFLEFNSLFKWVLEQDWINAKDQFDYKLRQKVIGFLEEPTEELDPLIFYMKNLLYVHDNVNLFACCSESWFEDTWLTFCSILKITRNTGSTLKCYDIIDKVDEFSSSQLEALKKFKLKLSVDTRIKNSLVEIETWTLQCKVQLTSKLFGSTKVTYVKEWSTILDNINDRLYVLQSMKDIGALSYLTILEMWVSRLSDLENFVSRWIDIQLKYIHLAPAMYSNLSGMFSNSNADFKGVEEGYMALINFLEENSEIISILSFNNLFHRLDLLEKSIDISLKELSGFLDSLRNKITRLYFMNDEDLLELLGSPNDSEVIQKHIRKMFFSVESIIFDKSSIVGCKSPENECIFLSNPMDLSSDLELWLSKFEHLLLDSIKSQIWNYNSDPKIDIENIPEQVILVGTHFKFTLQVEQFILQDRKDWNTIIAVYQDHLAALHGLESTSLHASLSKKSLILQTIYFLDVLISCAEQKSSKIDEWSWYQQIRYKVIDEALKVNCVDASTTYTYEYQGNSNRLVHTPLTQKCLLTLFQAMKNGVGGNPFGPAGTGKTETVKMLGSFCGRKVLVFNCDQELDFKSVSRILSGVISSGSFVCFDEFNRLALNCLASVSVHLQNILIALRAKRETINIDGKTFKLDHNCCIFVTLNPPTKAYGGRRKLPENLKQLFVSVAMTEPDLKMVAISLLSSEGFLNAAALGVKLASFYNGCKSILSRIKHYEWGIRSLKPIISIAGNSLRAGKGVTPDCEYQYLARAVYISNLGKLAAEDVRTFCFWLHETFSFTPKDSIDDEFYESLSLSVQNLQFDPVPSQLEKVSQLINACDEKVGVALIGPPHSGKTTSWKLYQEYLKANDIKVNVFVINPKSMKKTTLFGNMNYESREWSDGALIKIFRQLSQFQQKTRVFIVFDGIIDPDWIEFLNTVLDDNRLFTLPTGERIQIPRNVNLLFETNDLTFASPATISRLSIVLFDSNCLDFNLLHSKLFLSIQDSQDDEKAKNMSILQSKLLPPSMWKYYSKNPTIFDSHLKKIGDGVDLSQLFSENTLQDLIINGVMLIFRTEIDSIDAVCSMIHSDSYELCVYQCSPLSEIEDLVELLLKKGTIVKVENQKILKPHRFTVLYTKDLQLAPNDTYATVRVQEFLIHLYKFGGFYTFDGDWVILENFGYVASSSNFTTISRLRHLSLEIPHQSMNESLIREKLMNLYNGGGCRCDNFNRSEFLYSLCNFFMEILGKKLLSLKDIFALAKKLSQFCLSFLSRTHFMNVVLFEFQFADISIEKLDDIKRSLNCQNTDISIIGFSTDEEKKFAKPVDPFEFRKKITECANFYTYESLQKIFIFDEMLPVIFRLINFMKSADHFLCVLGESGVGKRLSINIAGLAENIPIILPRIAPDNPSRSLLEFVKTVAHNAISSGTQIVLLENVHIENPVWLKGIHSFAAKTLPCGIPSEEIEAIISFCKSARIKSVEDLETAFFSSVKFILKITPVKAYKVLKESYPLILDNLTYVRKWKDDTLNFLGQQLFSDLCLENSAKTVHNILTICKLETATVRQTTFFFSAFRTLFVSQYDQFMARLTFYKSGIEKLQILGECVQKLKESCLEQQRELEIKRQDAKNALQSITEKLQEASVQQQETEKLSATLEEQELEIRRKSEEINMKIKDIEPILQEARSLCGNIKPEHLNEIRSLRAPPVVIRDILEAVLRLIGVNDASWNNMKLFLGKRTFKEELLTFDARKITSSIKEDVKKLIFERSASFDDSNVKRSSIAVAPLAFWIRANLDYADILENVMPMESELRQYELQIQQSKEQIGKCTEKVHALGSVVSDLQKIYAEKILNMELLKVKTESFQSQLDRGSALLENLASEKDRWNNEVQRISFMLSEYVNINLLMSSLCVFGSSLDFYSREEKLLSWKNALNLNCGEVLHEYFVDTSSQQGLKTLGLVPYRQALENMTWIKYINRIPLIVGEIDETKSWLKHFVFENKDVETVSVTDKHFVRSLESTLKFGKNLVITLFDSIPSTFVDLLKQNFVVDDTRKIYIGDKLVDVDDNFRIVLLSTNSSFCNSTEDHIWTINFTHDEQAFSEEILKFVVEKKFTTIEEELVATSLKKSNLELKLKGLEENLLKELSNFNYEMLKDDKIINSLIETRNQAMLMEAEAFSMKEVEKNLYDKRRSCQGFSSSMSKLFFALKNAKKLAPSYSFGKNKFLAWIEKILQNLSDDALITSENLISVFPQMMSLVRSSLMGDDFLAMFLYIYSVIFCKNTSKTRYQLDAIVSVATNAQHRRNYKILQILFPDFYAKIVNNFEKWQDWLSGKNDFPFELKYERFACQLLFNPAEIKDDLQMHVKNVFDISAETLITTINDFSHILLISSAGCDLTTDISVIAQKRNMLLVQYFLVELRDLEILHEKILEATTKPIWIFIQNIHMSPLSLNSLESFMKISIHSDSRIFVSCELSAEFDPQPIKQFSKFAAEKEETLQLLIKDFSGDTEDHLNLLCGTFHGILVQRQRYIPFGWTKPFDLTSIELLQLKNLLQTPSQYRKDVLQGLITNVIYGGRIERQIDDKILFCLTEKLLEDDCLEGKRFPLLSNDFVTGKDTMLEPSIMGLPNAVLGLNNANSGFAISEKLYQILDLNTKFTESENIVKPKFSFQLFKLQKSLEENTNEVTMFFRRQIYFIGSRLKEIENSKNRRHIEDMIVSADFERYSNINNIGQNISFYIDDLVKRFEYLCKISDIYEQEDEVKLIDFSLLPNITGYLFALKRKFAQEVSLDIEEVCFVISWNEATHIKYCGVISHGLAFKNGQPGLDIKANLPLSREVPNFHIRCEQKKENSFALIYIYSDASKELILCPAHIDSKTIDQNELFLSGAYLSIKN